MMFLCSKMKQFWNNESGIELTGVSVYINGELIGETR